MNNNKFNQKYKVSIDDDICISALIKDVNKMLKISNRGTFDVLISKCENHK